MLPSHRTAKGRSTSPICLRRFARSTRSIFPFSLHAPTAIFGSLKLISVNPRSWCIVFNCVSISWIGFGSTGEELAGVFLVGEERFAVRATIPYLVHKSLVLDLHWTGTGVVSANADDKMRIDLPTPADKGRSAARLSARESRYSQLCTRRNQAIELFEGVPSLIPVRDTFPLRFKHRPRVQDG